MLLTICARGEKTFSFFDDEIKNYLLDETKNTPLRNVTLLAGLAVNTSPAPDFMFGNRKLRWGDSPLFLSNSLLMNIDYATGKLYLRDKVEENNLKSAHYLMFSGLIAFRF